MGCHLQALLSPKLLYCYRNKTQKNKTTTTTTKTGSSFRKLLLMPALKQSDDPVLVISLAA